MNPVTHQMAYGVLSVGEIDGAWRQDVYTDSSGKRYLEPAVCTGPDDVSPRQNKMTCGEGAGYDPDCSCCWLNITHTQDKHKKALGQR